MCRSFLCLFLRALFSLFPRRFMRDLDHNFLDFARKQILYLFGVLLRLRGQESKREIDFDVVSDQQLLVDTSASSR